MWLALLAAAASKFKYNIPCKFHFLLSGVLYLQEKKRFYCSKVQASLVFLAKEIVLNCCLKSSIFFKNKVHSNIPLYKKNGWAVVVCTVQNKHLSRHCSPSSSSLLLLLCNFFSVELFELRCCKKHMFTSKDPLYQQVWQQRR